MAETGQVEVAEPAAGHPVPLVEAPPEAAPERAGALAVVLTILLGLAILVALIPFVQWVDCGTDYSPFEMSAPPAGAMGLLFALLLVNLVVFVIARIRALGRWQVVLLYVILMTGLPVANLGLIQPVFTSMTAVASEYVNRQVPAVAPSYAAQDPTFYPKIRYTHTEELAPEQRDAQIEPLRRFWSGIGLGLQEEYRLRDATLWQRLQFAWGTIPWKSIWLWPLVNWGVFILVLFLGIMFLVEILRQQWVERENLAFPLAVLPAALIEETTSRGRLRHRLLVNPLFWIGMVIPILLLALSGIKHYDLKRIAFGELMIDFRSYLTKAPWDAIKTNILVFSPLLIGIGYLVHLEISRSIWIFFLVGTIFTLVAVNLGWNVVETPPEPLDWQAPGYPYPRDQAVGAMLVLAGFLLWRSRGGLWALVKAPFASAAASSTSGFMPPRLAGWGFVACFAFLMYWMWRMMAITEGFPPPDLDVTGEVGSRNWPGLLLIFLWLGVFFLMIVAFARLRAEAGIPNNFLVPSMIRWPRVVGGPATWGWQSTHFLNHYSWMALSTLPAMAPLQLEGLEVARRHGPGPRTVALGVVLAFVVALVAGTVVFLWNCYFQGAEKYVGKNISNGTMPVWVFYRTRGKNLDIGYFHQPQGIAMIVGLALMAGLLMARSKWMRFPLHPLGYLIWCVAPAHQALMQSDKVKAVHVLWGPMLIAWLLKRTVIRYGGMKLYQKLLPIFLGMIFGQLLMLVFWTLAHGVMLFDFAKMEPLMSLENQPEVYRPQAY